MDSTTTKIIEPTSEEKATKLCPSSCDKDIKNGEEDIAKKDVGDNIPCRVLTQYVFVNQPVKKKKCKRFGITCKKDFVHNHHRKDKPSLVGNKKKTVMKTNIAVSSCNKSKSESKKTIESLKVMKNKNFSKETIERSPLKDSLDTAERAEGQVKSANKVRGIPKKRILSHEEKVDVIIALSEANATIESVSAEFGVARTDLQALKDDVLNKDTNELKPEIKNKLMAKIKAKANEAEKEFAVVSGKAKPSHKVLTNEDIEVESMNDSGNTERLRSREELNRDKKALVVQGLWSGEVCPASKRMRECKQSELDKVLLRLKVTKNKNFSKESIEKSPVKDSLNNATWMNKNSKRVERQVKSVKRVRLAIPKKRNLSHEEKVDMIIALSEANATVDSVSEEYGVVRSVLQALKDDVINKDANKLKPEIKDKLKAKIQAKGKEAEKVFAIISGEEKPSHKVISIEDQEDKPLDDSGNTERLRSRKELTLDQKASVVQELQAGCKVTHIAKKYGVSSSAVSRVNKNQTSILNKIESGDVCPTSKRMRECKEPELDKALLRWYRAIEKVCGRRISISNFLLKEKSFQIMTAMGLSFTPSNNWIIRWKYRHNVLGKEGRIETKEELDDLEKDVSWAEIISSVEGASVKLNVKKERIEESVFCKHCGVKMHNASNRRSYRKRTIHLKGCPFFSLRKDLTLAERVKVVEALDKPGVKMVDVAKMFSISTSSISRINKGRTDILSQMNEGYINMGRKRSRGSNEPDVEKQLCDWYRSQQEMGIHVPGSQVRERAREIAATMGREFYPSDSWVFRWRQRNNVNGNMEWDESGDEVVENVTHDNHIDAIRPEDISENSSVVKDTNSLMVKEESFDDESRKGKRKRESKDNINMKQKWLSCPKSVMCEKCGYVSIQSNSNRSRRRNLGIMKHEKGCPLMRPKRELTFEDRVKILGELEEPGATLSSVGRKYGVSTSSMSRIKNNKVAIMTHGRKDKKRNRECKEPEIAKKLYSWYQTKVAQGIHVTIKQLKEKASTMAKAEGRDFKVSNGWLGRWKYRNNIPLMKQGCLDKVTKVVPKRKAPKKVLKSETVSEEPLLSTELSQVGSITNVVGPITVDVPSTVQVPQHMLFSQLYPQNPWETQTLQASRPKDYATTVSHTIPQTEDVDTAFPYDQFSSTRQMFHHPFETIALPGSYHPIAMGVNQAEHPLLGRDYVQLDHEMLSHNQSVTGISSSSTLGNVVETATIATSVSSAMMLHPSSSPQFSQPQNSSLINHHQFHPQQQLTMQQPQSSSMLPSQPIGQEIHQQQPSHSINSVPVLPDVNLDSESQVMEAFKIMSSFAQKKSLGADVQAALRTIELTMKNAGKEGKNSKSNSYTSI